MTAPAAAWSENDMLAYVRTACRELGLLVYHTHDSRRSEAGFPDCVIVGQGVLFAELKSHRGTLKPDQRRWGSALEKAGQRWTIWRPRDAIDGTVVRMLREIA